MVLLKLEGVRALAPMGVQMADDRLDEVSCGAVAAHVSSPYLQPPPAIAVGKKKEPMKKEKGQCDEMETKKNKTE